EGMLVSGSGPDDLIAEGSQQRDDEDPRYDPQQQDVRQEEVERKADEDRQEEDDEEEIRPAPHVQRRIPVDDLGLQRVPVLVRSNRLVFGPVVLVDAPDVGDQRDQADVAQEQPEPDCALDQVLTEGGVDPDDMAPE